MESLFGRQLALAHKAVRAELDQRLSEAGGSISSWIILRLAGESAPSQRELADKMGVEGPTLVRHLDRLESAGLIERRPDPADRRVTRIAVTGAGRRLFADLAVVANDMEAELRSLIGPEDYDRTLAVLQRLHSSMSRLAAGRRGHAHAAHHL
jgi:MarR family transcriptional regulator for hemolysin